MPLSANTKLGPYEILGQIGAGGMWEVYRARDTRLERTVAIKILSSKLSSNSSLKQRFEREAKTISNLSHLHEINALTEGDEDNQNNVFSLASHRWPLPCVRPTETLPGSLNLRGPILSLRELAA